MEKYLIQKSSTVSLWFFFSALKSFIKLISPSMILSEKIVFLHSNKYVETRSDCGRFPRLKFSSTGFRIFKRQLGYK